MKPGGERKDDRYQPETNGNGVDVYIVDSGVRTSHYDFKGRVATKHWEVDAGEVVRTMDFEGHGTSMASAALGQGAGSAKGARLVSVQVLNGQGEGALSGIVQGLDWIAQQPCERCVVSMSLGSERSNALNNAVQNLIAKGYPVVTSAGNDGIDACKRSPASVAEALTVGALDRFGDQSPFSNWGTCVDIWGPGEYVRTAAHEDWWGWDDDAGMLEISGTSPAAAIAAGVGALYLEAGVPEAHLKDSLVTGATMWGSHPFLSAFALDGSTSPPVEEPKTIFKETRGHVSGRRRWYTINRAVRSNEMYGTAGDVLICKMENGICRYGGCDADLRALSYTASRRRWWAGSWNAIDYSRSNILREDLEVRLQRSGRVACEAFYASGHADVTVLSHLASR